VSALAEALDSARSAAGADALADAEGLVGTLLDVVAIEPGWEDAVEAALGEALSAVVVESSDAARRALELFEQGRGSGAVIALDPMLPPALPGESSILNFVKPQRSDVAGVLGRLLADIDAVDADWRQALDRSVDSGRVVVTKSGDRIGGGLWRIGTSGVGATQAKKMRSLPSTANSRFVSIANRLVPESSKISFLASRAQRCSRPSATVSSKLLVRSLLTVRMV